MAVQIERVRTLNNREAGAGPVIYIMSRDQRVTENWALLYAQEQAIARRVSLIVVFNLFLIPERASLRHYDFMLKGLAEVETELRPLNIPFVLIEGSAEECLSKCVKKYKVGEIVTDFSPLKSARARRRMLAENSPVLVSEVDAHNIIPCWLASDKEEFAAYTFRPKVHRALSTYLTKFPTLKSHPYTFEGIVKPVVWEAMMKNLNLDSRVLPTVFIPGTNAGKKLLKEFIKKRLPVYDTLRNDPIQDGVSGLSPYLHFGQLSAQYVARVVSDTLDAPRESREAFLEELIVRRELADNYCFYNPRYDTLAGAHAWAQKTLQEHKNDPREYIYTKEQLESALTHDDLWNAMQCQMVQEGKMHGWCRMYWAKKILEWTPDVQTAIDTAVYLNDKYELDGYDPNGYVGILWSLCGVHDRAWNERNVFGKVRYMNYAGAKRKFDIKAYIERYGGKEKTLFN